MKLRALDVETNGTQREYGLQPWRVRTGDAWLTSIATCGAGSDLPRVWRQPDVATLRLILQSALDDGVTLVAWNAAFDIAWLIALGLGELVWANSWLDGMLVYKAVHNAPAFVGGSVQSFGLKSAVATHAGAMAQFAGYGDNAVFNPQTEAEWDELLSYNKLDALFTHRLTVENLAKLSAGQVRAVTIEAACLPMVAEANVDGIWANMGEAATLSEALRLTAAESLGSLVATSDVTAEQLASPKQLGVLLYDTWGLTCPKLTEKGANSTDKEALDALAVQDDRADLVRSYREANNLRTKFAEGTILSLNYNGDERVRPQARIATTYTGRMTYSSKQGKGADALPVGVALHQWKRDPKFRSLIEPPPGHTLIEVDFAGQEFRWMAVVSGDPTMLEMCLPGEDAHSFMGARVAGQQYREVMAAVAAGDKAAKASRQLGKVGNLSCQYRTGAERLRIVAKVQHGLSLTEVEAKDVWRKYRTTYPGVPRYWKSQIYLARTDGFVATPAGRRVQLPMPDNDWPAEFKWGYESTAINFPVQGAGADQKYLALLVLKNMLTEYDAKFYMELHDGLFVVAPHAKAHAAAHAIRAALSNLPYKRAWGVDLPIAFPVDAKTGPSWGALKELAQ